MADGIKVSASVFNLAGLSIQEFAALIGTATSATQLSGDVIARGMRTVLMNLRGVTDEVAETTEETISKSEEVLTRYGIIVRDSVNSFRDPMEVFSEISEKFKTTLKDNEVAQSEIISTLAGKRQANILSSVIQNWEMVEKQQLEAMYSMGSAMKENEIYMDSWKAKSNQLASAVTRMWQTSINTDLVKRLIDGLRTIVEWMTKFGGVIPIVAGALSVVLVSALIKVDVAAQKLVLTLTTLNIKAAGIPMLIGLAVTALTAFGMKVTGAADANNTLNSSLISTIQSQTDAMKTESERIKLVETMTKRLDELAGKENKTTKETTELKIITEKLNDIYPSLGINIDNVTGKYKNQITQLNRLTEAEKANLQQKLEMKKKEVNLQLIEAGKAGKKSLEKAEKANVKFEAVTEFKNLVDTGVRFSEIDDKLFKQATGTGKNALSGDQKEEKQFTEKLYADQLRIALNTQKQADAYKTLLDTYQEINVQLIQLQNPNVGVPFAPNRFIQGKGTSGTTEEDDDILSTTTSGGSSPTLKNIKIDQFYKEREAVATLNQELERNKRLTDSTDDEEEKIRLLQERIGILQKGTGVGTSPLRNIADAMRKQIMSNIAKLSASGINAFYDEVTNQLSFENLEDIDNFQIFKNGVLDIEATNEAKTALDELAKDTQRFRDEVGRFGGNWWSLDGEMPKSMEEIKNLQEVILKKLLDQFGNSAKFAENAIIDLENALSNLSDDEFIKKLEIQNRLLNFNEIVANKYKDELVELETKYKSGSESAQSYIDKHAELTKKQKDAESSTKKLRNEIIKTNEEIDKLAKSYVKIYVDYLKEQVQERIDLIEEEKNTFVNAKNLEIEALEQLLNKNKEENDILKEQIEREERLLNIAKAKEKLGNLENERTARIFKDGRFQYVADPIKVREQKEEIAKLEKDFTEWEMSNSVRATELRIRKEIDMKKEEIRQKEALARNEQLVLKTQLNTLDEIVNTSVKNQITSYDQLENKLRALRSTTIEEVAKIRSAISSLNSVGFNFSAPSSNSTSSKTVVYPSPNPSDYPVKSTPSNSTTKSVFNPFATAPVLRDTGGTLKSGSTAINLSGENEYVLNPEQTKSFSNLVNMLPNMANVINFLKNTTNIPNFGSNNAVLSNSVGGNTYVNIDKIVTNNAQDFVSQLKRIVKSKG
jgi:hypothetical protein